MSADNALRWLITGANSGFGAAFTKAVLGAGDEVVAAVRRPESMAEVVAAHPDRVRVVALDVRDAAAAERAVKEAGRVDVLVNNAGYGIVGAIEETAETDLRDAMEVMFFGPLRLTRLVLPQMRERGSGAIVQLTSMGGFMSFAGVGAYSAAKGALELASEALAAEVNPLGIQVLIVEPGEFRTGFAKPAALTIGAAIPDYAETVGAIRDGLPASDQQQSGDPDKAAAAVLATVGQPNAPLRLALGPDAVGAIRGKLATVAAELDATAHLGLATGFDQD
ncbi:SDR family NAD(P)-dependent oxidoreductase [Nocardia yunnanensis]|uniref:SDR family NAD(P)-dependent oxidoreductase n=1 Tax=Nocardia yunnanensis TaxID=2382165 RepID=A0A386ZIM2_9NOCA|nr:SDR family NAD(P)-dependent oxidoreductase [Nocardia yunnanensis]AYF77388.1 SDR family NAD(P)-dependent oxidoreductase [Nocardia yunnanensis]